MGAPALMEPSLKYHPDVIAVLTLAPIAGLGTVHGRQFDWGFDQELAPHHLTFRHRAGVTLYTSTFVFAECCVFIKQSQPPFLCNPHPLRTRGATRTGGTPYPEVTVSICRVPSPEFSQAPWNFHPAHLCRFAVRSSSN